MSKQIVSQPKKSPRKPVQTRGIHTREMILNAGEKLFAKVGYHSVLADDVACEAGVSVGSFYSYFKDKRALFLAILERNSEAILTRAETAFSTYLDDINQDIATIIQNTLLILIKTHEGILPMHQEAQQMALFDPDFEEYLHRMDQAVQQVFEQMLCQIQPELDKNRIPAMSYVLYHASEGIIHHIIGYPNKDIDKEKILSETIKFFSAYINRG